MTAFAAALVSRVSSASQSQNAPNKMAPTKRNTAHTTSTFSFKARSTCVPPTFERWSVTERRSKPKRQMCCNAENAAAAARVLNERLI
jgi:hypothetical protein